MTSNVNSIVQNVIRIHNGTIKHVNVDVKIMVSASSNYNYSNIIVGILAHVYVKIVCI